MKILSLWEPWASLMAIGAKKIETRSWSTDYRGWLAIHAAKGGLTIDDLEEQCCKPYFYEAMRKHIPEFTAWDDCPFDLNGNKPNLRRWQNRGVFPFGCVVGIVKLIDCCPMADLLCLPGVFQDYPTLDTPQGRSYGNFDAGRWAWVTEQAFCLPEPIPFKGSQGLRDLPVPVECEILRQLPFNPR